MPMVIFQTWVTCLGSRLTRDELNISLDKVVLSCNNFGSYYLHGQTGRLKETLNKGSL